MDTVGRKKKAIEQDIRNQLEEDYASEQISIKEFTAPFPGRKNKKAKKAAARERLPERGRRCQTFSAPFRG